MRWKGVRKDLLFLRNPDAVASGPPRGRMFQGAQTRCLSVLCGFRGERLFRNCALHTNRGALVAQTGDFP
jgi:hypothetical protein